MAAGRVESTRILGEDTTTECRYCLCSFTDLARFAEAARGYRAIENGQHWVLDVQFGEDANRARADFQARRLARFPLIPPSLFWVKALARKIEV